MALDATVIGADRVGARIDDLARGGAGARLVRDSGVFVQREAASGARGLGGIPSSFVAESHGLSARIVSRHPGAFPMEVGRRPGAQMPPVEAITAWMSSHGITGSAYVIARAIARRGIRGRFYIRHARERLMSMELPRLARRATDDIARAWSAR